MNIMDKAISGLGKIEKMVNNADKAIAGIYGGIPKNTLKETGYTDRLVGSVRNVYKGANEINVTGDNVDFLKKSLGKDTLKVGDKEKLNIWDRYSMLNRKEDGSMDIGNMGVTIAGSYIAGSAALRVASGGGWLKDSSGNTNIIGVPLV